MCSEHQPTLTFPFAFTFRIAALGACGVPIFYWCSSPPRCGTKPCKPGQAELSLASPALSGIAWTAPHPEPALLWWQLCCSQRVSSDLQHLAAAPVSTRSLEVLLLRHPKRTFLPGENIATKDSTKSCSPVALGCRGCPQCLTPQRPGLPPGTR